MLFQEKEVREMNTKFWSQNLTGKDRLGDLGVDGILRK
jgi:hypothetical protein